MPLVLVVTLHSALQSMTVDHQCVVGGAAAPCVNPATHGRVGGECGCDVEWCGCVVLGKEHGRDGDHDRLF